MSTESAYVESALDRFGRAPFALVDILRRSGAVAVVNTGDDVAPPSAIEPFIAAMPAGVGRIIHYPGEIGVGLQHLGILVGRNAQAAIWPQIFAWMHAPHDGALQ